MNEIEELVASTGLEIAESTGWEIVRDVELTFLTKYGGERPCKHCYGERAPTRVEGYVKEWVTIATCPVVVRGFHKYETNVCLECVLEWCIGETGR